MTYPKEILDFLQNSDELGIKGEDNIAVICPVDLSIIELLHKDFNNIFLVSENEPLVEQAVSKYKNVKILKGNEAKTGLEDKSINNIFIYKSEQYLDLDNTRIEFRRILKNYWSDLVIFENKFEQSNINTVTNEILEGLFAGSWYDKKEFEYEINNRKVTTILYWNPPGFNEQELHSQEIVDFVNSCENYCKIFENFTNYRIKDFLFEIQKSLLECYYKVLFLPESCGSDKNELSAHDIKMSNNVINFHVRLNELAGFLGKHDMYWSNFDPYPEDEDKETFEHSLSCDLAEIYEDIKSNLIVFEKGNLYDKQQTLWQWKFDWRGHTGNHLTFAFRAIHWKLQYLEYEDD